MANENERMRIRQARYVPDRAYEAAVERTLSNLPPREHRKQPDLRRVAAALAAMAACVLVLVPVVKAAAPLMGRLFSDVVATIEARQALPEDARFVESLAQREAWIRTHPVSGEVQFEGAKIRLEEMAFMRNDSDVDSAKPDGLLELRLRYDRIPAFDPNYIAFTVRYGGRVYEMPADENLAEYRAEGKHARTIADWRNIGTYGQSGTSSLQAGEPETLLRFQVDPWKLSEKTEIVLEGVLDGKLFSLPFTFDPELAHQSAIEVTRANLSEYQEHDEKVKDYVSALGAAAADLQLGGELRGVRYQLSQVALNDGALVIGWTVARADGESSDFNGAWLEEFTVDGYPLPESGSSLLDQRADGSLGLITRKALARDMDKLPPQSLIALQLTVDESGESARLAFRYNWAERTATAPKDEAEMKAWLAESDALAANLAAGHPERIRCPIEAAPQTDNGITVTLYAAELTSQGIELLYRSEAEDAAGLHLAEQMMDHPSLTIDGLAANGVGGCGSGDESGYFFELPVHYTELRDGAQGKFSLTMELTDDAGTVLRSGNFAFSFVLDAEASDA